MRTGELARKAGVNLQTIRFYEREGLLPEPARNVSGYRSYQTSDLDRVIFIRRNQELGFTLAENEEGNRNQRSGFGSSCGMVSSSLKYKGMAIERLQVSVAGIP